MELSLAGLCLIALLVTIVKSDLLACPPEAVPVSKLESGSISPTAFDVPFVAESGHSPRRGRCRLSAKSAHKLRSYVDGWRVEPLVCDAATSIQAHQPDLIGKHGTVSGEQATLFSATFAICSVHVTIFSNSETLTGIGVPSLRAR